MLGGLRDGFCHSCGPEYRPAAQTSRPWIGSADRAADRPPARVRPPRVRPDRRARAERAVRRDALADARARRRSRDRRRQRGRGLHAGDRRRVRARHARAGVDRGVHGRQAVGAAYLVYLGVQAFRHRRSLAEALHMPVEPKVLRRILADGFVVGVFNPKVIVFFMAVLPQFVDRSGLGRRCSCSSLGAIFCAIALLCDSPGRCWQARPAPGSSPRRGACRRSAAPAASRSSASARGWRSAAGRRAEQPAVGEQRLEARPARPRSTRSLRSRPCRSRRAAIAATRCSRNSSHVAAGALSATTPMPSARPCHGSSKTSSPLSRGSGAAAPSPASTAATAHGTAVPIMQSRVTSAASSSSSQVLASPAGRTGSTR